MSGSEKKKQEQSSSNNADVEHVLSDIENIAGQVDQMIGPSEKSSEKSTQGLPFPSKSKPAESGVAVLDEQDIDTSFSNETASADLSELDKMVEDKAHLFEQELKSKPKDKTLELDEKDFNLPEEPPIQDINIDEHTDLLAEDEISNAFNRLNKSGDALEEPTDDLKPAEALDIENVPKVFRMILNTLLFFDRPFLWLPRSFKEIIGYLAISVLIVAAVVWFILLCVIRKT
jgi:hypothetical protein